MDCINCDILEYATGTAYAVLNILAENFYTILSILRVCDKEVNFNIFTSKRIIVLNHIQH